MEYKVIERLSNADFEKLSLLIASCNGYEPFYLTEEEIEDLENYDSVEEMNDHENYDSVEETEYLEDYGSDELHQLAAYDYNGTMVGFISFIYDKAFNCCVSSDNKDNYYKDLSQGITKDLPELTALVAPEYRHQGIFSEMFSQIKAATGINAFIVSGNLQKEPAFSEYLMKLTADEYAGCIKQNCCKIHSSPTAYSFYFEEHDSVYAMYDPSHITEEIAYCRLSFQPSFTVLSNVYVDKELRGNGLGSIFIKNFIMDYFSKYTQPLVLNVRSINIPALRIYQKCGFNIVETVKYYVI